MKEEILLKSNLVWILHPTNDKYFYINKDYKIILLRINNFPEEPLFTLIDGLNILDIDDRPSGWKFEVENS